MCRDVSRGFGLGAGGEAERWCRYKVEDGPEESSRGSVGWKEREVIALGWTPGMSFCR